MARQPNGIVLWQGRSLFNGQRIVVILTGLSRKSKNDKTGQLMQTHILVERMCPVAAVYENKDRAICYTCPLKGKNGKGRGCYVVIHQSPYQIWRCYKRGGYPMYDPAQHDELLRDATIRIGSYGDPTAVPFSVWENIVSLAGKHTGYTHFWRENAEYAGLLQASVASKAEKVEANLLGYSTFRMALAGSDALEDEVHCMASPEKGKKTNCNKCAMCNGTRNVLIWDHGCKAAISNCAKARLVG